MTSFLKHWLTRYMRSNGFCNILSRRIGERASIVIFSMNFYLRMGEKRPGVVFRINMEKAYAHVDWSFVEFLWEEFLWEPIMDRVFTNSPQMPGIGNQHHWEPRSHQIWWEPMMDGVFILYTFTTDAWPLESSPLAAQGAYLLIIMRGKERIFHWSNLSHYKVFIEEGRSNLPNRDLDRIPLLPPWIDCVSISWCYISSLSLITCQAIIFNWFHVN